MTTEPIHGKVARILNSRELALNIGKIDGVELNMYFDVLDPKGEDIIDPDTGALLGSLQRPKVRVKIVKVLDQLSVGSTFKKHTVNKGGLGMGTLELTSFAQELLPPNYVTEYENLKTSEKTWEDLSEQESYVKTGDPVIQVIGNIEE